MTCESQRTGGIVDPVRPNSVGLLIADAQEGSNIVYWGNAEGPWHLACRFNAVLTARRFGELNKAHNATR